MERARPRNSSLGGWMCSPSLSPLVEPEPALAMAKEMLPKYLWPKVLVNDDAKAYTVTSKSGAKITVRRNGIATLTCTVESSCSFKGNERPRKSVNVRKTGDVDSWWQKIAAIACECDTTSAWETPSDSCEPQPTFFNRISERRCGAVGFGRTLGIFCGESGAKLW